MEDQMGIQELKELTFLVQVIRRILMLSGTRIFLEDGTKSHFQLYQSAGNIEYLESTSGKKKKKNRPQIRLSPGLLCASSIFISVSITAI